MGMGHSCDHVVSCEDPDHMVLLVDDGYAVHAAFAHDDGRRRNRLVYLHCQRAPGHDIAHGLA
jgi:hypothetical protein